MRLIANTIIPVAISLIIVAGCGETAGDHTDKAATVEDGIGAVLKDGPLTEEARAQIALLADTVATNDGEAYQTLKRIGRDAVPALVEALYGSHSETIKRNSLWVLGEIGVASAPAAPFLEDIKIKGPTWLSFAANQALRRIEQSESCGLSGLPDAVEVHVVGRYRGTKELDIQLGESGHTVTEIEVVVDHTDKPAVLVLTAYDPVVWKVGYTPEANLAAVLVSGYHTQALLGIPRTLNHKVISGEQSVGCDPFNASGPGDAATIEADIVRLTGHGIDKFHGASPAEHFRIGGDPRFEPSHVTYSPDFELSDYPVYGGDIPAGTRGLDELQRRGKIRMATQTDLDEWMNGARLHDPEMNVRLYTGSVYVVLDEITLPPGLYGGHSRAFIIPANAPKPDGPKGHCQFYYLEDFTRE